MTPLFGPESDAAIPAEPELAGVEVSRAEQPAISEISEIRTIDRTLNPNMFGPSGQDRQFV